MSATTKIEWATKSWNPVRGCSIVSPGCVNCYAMKQGHRFSGKGKAYEGLTELTKAGPQWTGKIRLVDDALLEPLSWRAPAQIFVNSMSDLFHEDVPFDFIDKVFAVMAVTPQHTYQILTKRAKRMLEYVGFRFRANNINDLICRSMGLHRNNKPMKTWPLPNVWLGVSAENQKAADDRIDDLLLTPAAVHWVSAEPLLDDLDLTRYLTGDSLAAPGPGGFRRGPKLDWVVVGGESGPGARDCCLSWIRNVVHDCADAGVACFVKQLGARPYETDDNEMTADWPVGKRLKLKHRKGGDIAEFEPYLQVRQFPRTAA